MFINY